MKNLVNQDDYRLYKELNIRQDKKLATVQTSSYLAALCLLFAIGLLVGPSFSFTTEQWLFGGLIVAGSLLIFSVIHELIHGFVMKRFYPKGHLKLNFESFALTALMPTVGFKKKEYSIMLVMPVIVLGIIILIVNIFIPREFFWIVYIIQIQNIAGSTSDLVLLILIRKYPKEILIQDNGLTLSFYLKPETIEDLNQKKFLRLKEKEESEKRKIIDSEVQKAKETKDIDEDELDDLSKLEM